MKVAVIGGGAMGSAAAWRMAVRGVDVVCFDRHSPPHTLGSSHGESRIIRTAYFEGPWYVPLLHETFGLWRELEAATGADLLTVTGGLMIGSESSAVVRGALESARRHDLDVDMMSADIVRERYPGHAVNDDDVGVLDRQAGFVRPEDAVGAMLSQVPDVRRETVVSGVRELLDRFDAVVVAAGPWTAELIPWLPLRVERQVLAWFAIEDGVDWLTPDRFPVFIRESDGTDVYGFPTLDGVSVKVARHHEGVATDPYHIDRAVDDTDLNPLKRYVAHYMRGVSTDIVRTATCMYTNTPDGHFAIGRDPNDPRVTVISACSGHGFKFAPVIGDIAADLVIDGRTSRDISELSLSRFAPGDPARTR